ncbi:hypothetical protein CPB83DRAFT_748517, partial [Crepidotus variabilis]
VVVKFRQTYGEVGRKLLSSKSLAPRFRFCRHVELVRMLVVVMDFIEGIPLVANSLKLDIDPGTFKIQSLRDGLKELHNQVLVHGELSASKIVLGESGVMLLDFEYCGPERTARYPVDVDTGREMGRQEGSRRGGLIKKIHD